MTASDLLCKPHFFHRLIVYNKCMLVLKEHLWGMPILSLQTGTQIAQTAAPIIDPRELKIVAFYCEGPHLDTSPAVLHIDDIREISNLGFIVDGAESIMPPTDLVRLQQIIGFNFQLEGKLVVEDSGRKVGKVHNYTVDTKSFYITQIHAQPNIWQSFSVSDVPVGRAQIKEITDDKIVVRSATIPAKQQAAPMHNPFHQHQPQTEASHSHK
jgi:sporulation protein YlmC with PRC-barrel domain